jgi:hypothetical protein
MGRVLTNNLSLSYSIESSLEVAGEDWHLLEPNAVNTFGATITTTPRNPISKNRQRRKGTTTDLDSAVEFEHDLTLSAFLDFIEGFVFASAKNGDLDLGVSAVDGTGDTYAVGVLNNSQGARLNFSATEFATLLYARGFANAANNGLKSLAADLVDAAAATATLTVTPDSPPDIGSGDTVTIDGVVYEFVAVPTDPYDVDLGADDEGSLVNLARAINGTGTPGTDYAAGTEVHPTVMAANTSALVLTATARTPGSAGNDLEASTDITAAAWSNSGDFTGGTDVGPLLAVDEDLTEEATPPASAHVELAGLRSLAAAADFSWAWDAGSKTATLTSAADIADFEVFGLTPGQFVHIGSPDGNAGVHHAFENDEADDMYGYARVRAFGAGTIVFDKVEDRLQFNATAPATAVDMLFGRFIRNVPVDHADYLERSFQFEAEWPNLGEAGAAGFEYAKGNYCNTAQFNLPLTDKASVTFGFIGTDTDVPVGPDDRKTGAANAQNPTQTAAFNTSADILRLRITKVDESGLTTDFKSVTLTLGNNVGPEKVLGKLGAKYMNTGNFDVDLETQVLFTSGEVVGAVRDNLTVSMDFVIRNDDGSIAVDIPSQTLGGGDRELPVNESVLVNLEGMAFEDPTFGTSIGVSVFPIAP